MNKDNSTNADINVNTNTDTQTPFKKECVPEFDKSLIKKIKQDADIVLFPMNVISFFMRMNFRNINSVIIIDEKENQLKQIHFMSHTNALGQTKCSLLMSETDYKDFLFTYGFKNILRWQANVAKNGYVNILVCIETETEGSKDTKESKKE